MGAKSSVLFYLSFSEDEFTKSRIKITLNLFSFWIIDVLCTLNMCRKGCPADVEVKAEEQVELILPGYFMFPQRFCIPCCRRGSEPFYQESRNDMGGICF